jgi:8-oxo-dGTP diphosphatase
VLPAVAAAHSLIAAIPAGDEVEERHRADALAWLGATDDVFRRVKPATPPRHLVSYVVPRDPADGAVLLVAHRNAGLWLPPGGHVEPGEDCAVTAVRELAEELGLTGDRVAPEPAFLTVTETVGLDAGHTDVSLWFVAWVGRGEALEPDAGEFTEVRWWTETEVLRADPGGFDPHLRRFLRKTRSPSA